MSGSSLDGLDLAWVHFETDEMGVTAWTIRQAVTIPFEAGWRTQLAEVSELSGRALWQLHEDFGRWCGQQCSERSEAWGIQPDLIASHGHTVFHHPDQFMTCQIGSGAQIAAMTGRPTVSDLRAVDVALGGEGAPMAVLADVVLFPMKNHFLNLGGIANLSSTAQGQERCVDVCPCNQWLDRLAGSIGMDMDEDGQMARAGRWNEELASRLRTFDFYHDHRTSLDNSACQVFFHEKIAPHTASVADKLRTVTAHIGHQIGSAFSSTGSGPILTTGGGAHNGFLRACISSNLPASMTLDIPSAQIVDYKEALLVALAGLYRILHRPTFMASYTKSGVDSVGGSLYSPGLG